MTIIYVDESGNLGKDGEYFVFGAIAIKNTENLKKLKRLVKSQQKEISLELNQPINELKSNKISFSRRQKILNKINKNDYDIFYLVAKKSELTLLKKDNLKDKTNLTYNYLAGILITNISKYYNNDITIIFDQRSTKVTSMNSLKDYINILVYQRNRFGHNLIFMQADSKSYYGLQLADIISGTIYRSYRDNKKHFLSVISSKIKSAILFPKSKFNPLT